MDRKLEFGTAFSRVLDLYSTHFTPLITYAAVVYGVLGVLWALVVALFLTSVAAGAAGAVISAVITVVGTFVLTGAYILALDDSEHGRPFPSFGETWPRVKPRVLALIGTAILTGLAVGFGLVLLVIPGLVLLTWFAVVSPVVMLEGEAGPAAMSRSRELVRGDGWTVFGLTVVVGLVTAIASGILGRITSAVFGFNDSVAAFASEFVSGVLTAPVGALLAVVIYEALTGEDGRPGQGPSGGATAAPGTTTPGVAPSDPGPFR